MKSYAFATLVAAIVAVAPVHAADDHKPQHGGVVVETKTGDMELVAKPDLIVIHVSDHGKPTKLTSATGKVTVFNGSVKTEAPLTLAAERVNDFATPGLMNLLGKAVLFDWRRSPWSRAG